MGRYLIALLMGYNLAVAVMFGTVGDVKQQAIETGILDHDGATYHVISLDPQQDEYCTHD